MKKTIYIHLTGTTVTEKHDEIIGRKRVFDLIHRGYGVIRSVFDSFTNTVYITLGVIA